MNEAPAQPWVALMKSGSVQCAHCKCMAGAGEACSHIGALLYAIMTGVRVRDETACTFVTCQWLAPAIVKKVFAINKLYHVMSFQLYFRSNFLL